MDVPPLAKLDVKLEQVTINDVCIARHGKVRDLWHSQRCFAMMVSTY